MQGLLPRKTKVYRSSRMTKAQADLLQSLIGERCRIGMYVATSTVKSAAIGLKEWQEGEMGEAKVKYMVRASVSLRAHTIACC